MRTTLRSIALCLSLISSQCAPEGAALDRDAPVDGAALDSAVDASVTPSPVDAPARATLSFASVLHEDRSWVVLDTSLDQPGHGALTALSASNFHQVASRALTDEAQARVAAARRVRVFKGSQWVCDAELGAAVALSVSERPWNEAGHPEERPLEEAWEAGLRSIAAPLTVLRGACSEGTWATDASLPEPRFATREAAPDAIARLAYEAVRRSAEGREMQAHFREFCEGAQCALPWDESQGIERTATLFHTSDGRRWVFAFVRDTEGCGGIGANISLFAEVQNAAVGPALLRVTTTTTALDAPDALVEREGASAWPELRTHTDRVVFSATGEWTIQQTIVPAYGCGC
jgi:hypothetical protein